MDQSQGLLFGQFLRPTALDFRAGPAYAPHQLRVSQDFQGFLEALEIRNTEDDGGRAAVFGDDDAAVLTLKALHDL